MKKLALVLLVASLGAGCAVNRKALVEKYQEITPTRFEGAVAVVLEDKQTARVDDQGKGLIMEGLVRTKLMNRQAMDCDSGSESCRLVQFVPYDETWDKVEMIEARTITPEGEVIEIKQEDMRDAKHTDWAVPDNSVRAFVWDMKGATPGSIFELKYRIRTSSILSVGGFRFQDRDPVLEASFTLDTPADYAYRWKTFNIDVKPTEVKKGNRLIRTWTAKQVPAFVHEEHMVAPDDVLAQLKVANDYIAAVDKHEACRSVKTWEQAGACWQAMIADKQNMSEGIKEIVAKIEAEAKTETEKLKAAWDYMNTNIRYVGLESGLAGLIPMEAAVVCSKKYGDCKAVAGLISVLCREMGMKADPILIGVRPVSGEVPLDLPGMFHFNHSIARVEADGKVYWMDATYRDVAFDVTPAADQGVNVIVARPGASFLDKIPVQGPDSNRADGKIVFVPDAEGNMTMEFKGTSTGNYAAKLRRGVNEWTPDQLKRNVESYVAKPYPQANVSTFAVEGKEDNNAPMLIKVTAKIPKALQPAGKGMSFEVKSPVSPSVFDVFELPKRRFAADLSFLGSSSVRYEIKIPEGMEPAGMPKNVIFEDDFVQLERLAQIENDKVVAEYKFSYKQLIIPPEKYAQARKSFHKALDAAGFVLLFEPPKKKKA